MNNKKPVGRPPKIKNENIDSKIRKVNIDAHIKASNAGSSQTTSRKRGRPRKNTESPNHPQQIERAGDSSFIIPDESSFEANNSIDQSHFIEPVYDTTEEAKGFLRAPFDIAAGLSGIRSIALYPEQLDALAPSFKVVYDKRIAPNMGENADLIAFAMVATGVIFEKILVYKNENEKPAEAVKNTDSSGAPFIPTEAHV